MQKQQKHLSSSFIVAGSTDEQSYRKLLCTTGFQKRRHRFFIHGKQTGIRLHMAWFKQSTYILDNLTGYIMPIKGSDVTIPV